MGLLNVSAVPIKWGHYCDMAVNNISCWTDADLKIFHGSISQRA